MKKTYRSTILITGLALAAVCFSGLTAQAGNPPSSYRDINFEYNTDHPGGDYTNFPTPDFQACAEACSNDRRCRAMSFNINNHVCELKDNISRPQPSQVVASGVKQGSGNSGGQGGYGNNSQNNYNNNNQGGGYNNNQGRGYGNNNQGGGYNNQSGGYGNNSQNSQNSVYGIQLYDNVKRNGGDYKNFRAANVEECAKICSRDNQCQSFNFGKAKRDCWLKNSVPGGVPNNTVISGVKQR